jgi:hypothetical protein
VRSGRNALKFLVLCTTGVSLCFPTLLANNEDRVSDGGTMTNGAGNRYDGVGLRSVPRPPDLRPPQKTRAVWTTMGRLAPPGDTKTAPEDAYHAYVALADQPFVSPREARITNAFNEQATRFAKRYGRKSIRTEFRAGPAMGSMEYVERLEAIERLGNGDSRLGIQHDRTDPRFAERYDPEWDSIDLVGVGPLSVTDSGSFDLNVDFAEIEKLWEVDLEDVVVAPAPPVDRPQPLVGKKFSLRPRAKVSVSSSRFFKTFVNSKPSDWGDELTSAARCARFFLEANFFTDIRRVRYLRAEVEFQIYPDGRWGTFLNVVFHGK